MYQDHDLRFDMDELAFLSAAELVDGYRAMRFSPEDVVESCLSRIARLNGRLHAFIEVFAAPARRAASASAKRYIDEAPWGPLDGVPFAVKDMIQIKGAVCTAGSPSRSNHRSDRSAEVCRRLLSGGLVVLGRTHTVEFAFGGWGTNEHFGAPINPWLPDIPHTAGGSSSGSAVAVAARMVPIALGTDTGGSVRVPAAFNGLVALKATPGLLSLDGVVPLSPSLDTVGPMGRTVQDVALFFQATLTDALSRASSLDGVDDNLDGRTIAIVGGEEFGHCHPSISQSFWRSLDALSRAGARVRKIELPKRLADYQRDSEIMLAEAYGLYGKLAEDRNTIMDSGVRMRLLGARVTSSQYKLAKLRAIEDARAFLSVMRGCHALLMPTTPVLPVQLIDVDETTTPSTLTRFVNQLGLCALAVPNGISLTGFPTSLQIVCRPHEDRLALRIGRACESILGNYNLPPSMKP